MSRPRRTTTAKSFGVAACQTLRAVAPSNRRQTWARAHGSIVTSSSRELHGNDLRARLRTTCQRRFHGLFSLLRLLDSVQERGSQRWWCPKPHHRQIRIPVTSQAPTSAMVWDTSALPKPIFPKLRLRRPQSFRRVFPQSSQFRRSWVFELLSVKRC